MSQSFSLSLSNENAMTHFICSLYLFRISELILSSAGQLTSQCLSQPISQTVSRPASQLANLSVYQLVSQQAKESDNYTIQLITQSAIKSVSLFALTKGYHWKRQL